MATSKAILALRKQLTAATSDNKVTVSHRHSTRLEQRGQLDGQAEGGQREVGARWEDAHYSASAIGSKRSREEGMRSTATCSVGRHVPAVPVWSGAR
jgi:hypothetical protein